MPYNQSLDWCFLRDINQIVYSRQSYVLKKQDTKAQKGGKREDFSLKNHYFLKNEKSLVTYLCKQKLRF